MGNKRPPKIKKEETENIVKIRNKQYLKVLTSDSVERFNEIGEMVKKKKLKWCFFKSDEMNGTHYYQIL